MTRQTTSIARDMIREEKRLERLAWAEEQHPDGLKAAEKLRLAVRTSEYTRDDGDVVAMIRCLTRLRGIV